MGNVEITRRVEFDSGHRIPNHASKCRNVHGHRYVLEATFTGPVLDARGMTDDGMVADFGDLKALMNRAVADVWDHGFLVYEHDMPMRLALDHYLEAGHKTIILPCVPTVENLARLAFEAIAAESKITLQRVRLYETPNCWADYPAAI